MVGNIVFLERGKLLDQIRLNGHESIVFRPLFFPAVCDSLLMLALALVSVRSLTAGQHCYVVNQSKRPILKNRSSCDHASGAVPARGTVLKKFCDI